jgi:hypothetical protein
VLRHRLFEIEVVVNRALLFGALAVFITAVYVAIVVGVGAMVGSRASPILSALAAAVVALGFLPARRRAQRLADRLVYAERATPCEVLSAFSERLGNVEAVDELLPRIARRLAEGTAAARVDVWLRFDEELRATAMWPEESESAPAIPVAQASEETVTPTAMFEPVRHRGELLGALSISKRAGDPVTAIEERLVRDLAAQAGLVLRNVALTERLMENVEQLRASRQRLVTARTRNAASSSGTCMTGRSSSSWRSPSSFACSSSSSSAVPNGRERPRPSCRRIHRPRSRNSATWRGGSIPRCLPIAGWWLRSMRKRDVRRWR